MQPSHNWTLQDGQVANAPWPTILDVRATGQASGTHKGALPPFEMQIQALGAYDLIDDAEFWQTEQGFDTINIHEQDSSFW
jgi:hypothetical protein